MLQGKTGGLINVFFYLYRIEGSWIRVVLGSCQTVASGGQ